MQGVACVMFHTVGIPDNRWKWNYLTVPWRLFDAQLSCLKRMGYRSVHLREYMEIALAGRLVREKIVSLTFDDGYLDNWVYAAPLLEKHGFKGTVFISTDFISPNRELRPQLDLKVYKNVSPHCRGFLSWEEARVLDASGIIEVQSHGLTHTWYPCGPRIVDFRHPRDSYYWMDWNAAPERKWNYMDSSVDEEMWGTPVYEHKKSLEAPRFYPDQRVNLFLCEHVKRKGKTFFENPAWRDELFTMAQHVMQEFNDTYLETEAEFIRRVREELCKSKILLENNLKKKIDFFCWPGGGYSQKVFNLASEYYVGTSVASSEKFHGARLDPLGCFRFSRIAPPGLHKRNSYRYFGPWMLALRLEEVRTGNIFARLIRGGVKVAVEKWEDLKCNF